MCVLSHYSCVRLFATPWTVDPWASLFMGFSRQEYWSGLPCPPPEDLPDPGIEPTSLMSPASVGGFFTTSTTWDILIYLCVCMYVYGEGNGTPLQCSCLENPMDRGPGGLQSMGSLGVRHNWATSLSLFTFMHWRRKWQHTPVFLPGESQGWGCTESDTTEVT